MRLLVITGSVLTGLLVSAIVWAPLEFIRARQTDGLPWAIRVASMSVPILVALVFGIRAYLGLARFFTSKPTPIPAVEGDHANSSGSIDPGSEHHGSDPAWCVAANVVMERTYGPDRTGKRRGTKQFAPGAKVYVYDFFWGMGGERVTVMGRHRKSHRFIRLRMRAKDLANWRAELVYSPAVAKVIRENAEFGSLDAGSDRAKCRAEEIAARYMNDGAPSQPYITRPPAPE